MDFKKVCFTGALYGCLFLEIQNFLNSLLEEAISWFNIKKF